MGVDVDPGRHLRGHYEGECGKMITVSWMFTDETLTAAPEAQCLLRSRRAHSASPGLEVVETRMWGAL